MPRNYNTFANSGGTNMVGRAYTPQVAPWDRDNDDVSVQRSLRDDPQEWRDQRDDQRNERSLDHDYDYRNRDRYARGRDDNESDAYYRRDLVPGYGDERTGYRDGRDERRAGRRAHWENREPDYRYQYNDYHRTDDNEARRENMARYRDEPAGYQRESDRTGWMSDRSHNRDWREDRYNDRERYYGRPDSERDGERDRGRWNRR